MGYYDNPGLGGMGGITGSGHCNIELCANYGRIRGFRYVGGIAGANHGSISNCYNSGDIICTKNGDCFGGIAGIQNTAGVYSINCYNIGNVVKGESTGGYYGAIMGTNSCEVENCYYLQTTFSGAIQSIDMAGKAEPRTGTFMKSSEFVNLLGSSNFKLVAGKNKGYPVLSWEDGEAITVDNYDIYYYGTLSKELSVNPFTNWRKGEVSFNSDHIKLDSISGVGDTFCRIDTKDAIDISKYNSAVITKPNLVISRVTFEIEANSQINLATSAMQFSDFSWSSADSGYKDISVLSVVRDINSRYTNKTKNIGDTYICDLRGIKDELKNAGYNLLYLAVSAWSDINDGNIYEMYFSTKTVDELMQDY